MRDIDTPWLQENSLYDAICRYCDCYEAYVPECFVEHSYEEDGYFYICERGSDYPPTDRTLLLRLSPDLHELTPIIDPAGGWKGFIQQNGPYDFMPFCWPLLYPSVYGDFGPHFKTFAEAEAWVKVEHAEAEVELALFHAEIEREKVEQGKA